MGNGMASNNLPPSIMSDTSAPLTGSGMDMLGGHMDNRMPSANQHPMMGLAVDDMDMDMSDLIA